MRLLVTCLLALLLLPACGPAPPETFLDSYFTALFVDANRDATLKLVQYPAGITAPPKVDWCFDAEQPFVTAVEASFKVDGATDPGARRNAWSKLRRDQRITTEQIHETPTTATVAVRIDPTVFEHAGVKDPKPLELDYVLTRDEQQVWHVSDVQVHSHDTGGEFTVKSHEKVNEDSKKLKDTNPWN